MSQPTQYAQQKAPLHSADVSHPISGIIHDPSTDNGFKLVGNWVTIADIRGVEGSYIQDGTAGDTCALQYAGASAWVRWNTGPDGGKASVAIDGVTLTPPGGIDLYNPTVGTYVKTVFGTSLPRAGHTLVITVLGTQNPNSTGTQVRLDNITTDNDVGILQILGIADETPLPNPTIGTPSVSPISNMVEGDGTQSTGITVPLNVGSAITNTNFVSMSIGLSITMNVMIVIQQIIYAAGTTLTLLRDGGQIANFSPSSSTWQTFHFLDTNVSSGSHTYSLQYNASAHAIVALFTVDQLMNESQVIVNSGASDNVPINNIVTNISANITLTKIADVWILLYYTSHVSDTLTVRRDGTTVQTINVSASPTGQIRVIRDSSVTAAPHTYNVASFTSGEGVLLAVVSNGG